MNDLIDDLVQRWKKNPSAATTVALCDALCDSPRVSLVSQVGPVAARHHAGDVTVLVSVARMYIECNRLAEAQAVLVSAGKQAPGDARVFRWLGEVLLRRGDAERAEKVLLRAVQLGPREPGAGLWLERSQSLGRLQESAGALAVAAEIARLTTGDGRSPSLSEIETRVFSLPALSVPMFPSAPTSAPIPAPTSAPMGAATSAPPSAPSSARIPPLTSAPTSAPIPLPTSAPGFAPPVPVSARAPASDPVVHVVPALRPTTLEPVGKPVVSPPGPWVPHPRDVMEALALAGVFELQFGGSPAPSWDRALPAPTGKRGPATIIAGIVFFLAAGVAIFVTYKHKRTEEHRLAEALLTGIEAELHEGRPDRLTAVEGELSRALHLESRSPRAALDWTRERAMVGLVKSGSDVAFEDAMTRAKDLGVPEEKYAFAQVASFLLQGDTAGAAAVLPRWDGPAGGDAWYQLVAGATLERAGDDRAQHRYLTASQIDPALFVARVDLARATAFDGDATHAMELARALRSEVPDRAEPVALVALAWGRDPMRELAPVPTEVEAVGARLDELPSGLEFVPYAVRALRALDRHDTDDARAQVQKGLGVCEFPGAAVWLGTIALSLGDEALARKAAVGALQFSAVYEPARGLAARVALDAGRLDEALKATEQLEPSPDVAIVRAAAAYERVDPDGVARALEGLPAEARKVRSLSGLTLGVGALSGTLVLDAAKIKALADNQAPWSDLVAMDVALDSGELTSADAIAATWGKDGAARPVRAVRVARLARYEGRLDAADEYSQAAMDRATVTPRALFERVFVLVARGRSADVGTLLARYPLALGPLATWLSAYASASNGSAEAAKGKTAALDPPPESSPLEARIVAAAAFGAMKDKRRGAEYVKTLLAGGILHPDLVTAALSLGFHRVEHGRRRPTYD
jgi:hypothetical protein